MTPSIWEASNEAFYRAWGPIRHGSKWEKAQSSIQQPLVGLVFAELVERALSW